MATELLKEALREYMDAEKGRFRISRRRPAKIRRLLRQFWDETTGKGDHKAKPVTIDTDALYILLSRSTAVLFGPEE